LPVAGTNKSRVLATGLWGRVRRVLILIPLVALATDASFIREALT
jgi:hypothetical protein